MSRGMTSCGGPWPGGIQFPCHSCLVDGSRRPWSGALGAVVDVTCSESGSRAFPEGGDGQAVPNILWGTGTYRLSVPRAGRRADVGPSLIVTKTVRAEKGI